jgi:hypothetical protein
MMKFQVRLYLYRSKINKRNINNDSDVGSTGSITTAPGRKEKVNSTARGWVGEEGREEKEGWGNK